MNQIIIQNYIFADGVAKPNNIAVHYYNFHKYPIYFLMRIVISIAKNTIIKMSLIMIFGSKVILKASKMRITEREGIPCRQLANPNTGRFCSFAKKNIPHS